MEPVGKPLSAHYWWGGWVYPIEYAYSFGLVLFYFVLFGLYSHFVLDSWDLFHDDVMIWKYSPHDWPFVLGIRWSLVVFPHKGTVMPVLDVSFDVSRNSCLNIWLSDWWFQTFWDSCDLTVMLSIFFRVASLALGQYCPSASEVNLKNMDMIDH